MIGAGGHARVVIEALTVGSLHVTGFVCPAREKPRGVMADLAWLGDDDSLFARGPQNITLVNGVGSTGSTERRRGVFERFSARGFSFATVVHPAAILASTVILGEGAQVMAGAVIQTGVQIGRNAIVNTGAVIDHDGVIGDHVHIAPRACLVGNVTIGEGAHIGAGATVLQNLLIGERALVAAGAVVVSEVPPNATVRGIPARNPSSGQSR